MAVGDIVNVFLSGGATTFQPASGVELILKAVFSGNATGHVGITDGVSSVGTYCVPTSGTSLGGLAVALQTYGLTNTAYFLSPTAWAISAIQIK